MVYANADRPADAAGGFPYTANVPRTLRGRSAPHPEGAEHSPDWPPPMPRIECPTCGTPDRADDRDLGKEWQCRRCRTAFVAEEVAPPPDRSPPADTAGRSAAVSSLLLGIGSVLASMCCGAGAVFALGGLATGFGGLQSRSRPLAITGLVLSTIGLVLSVSVLAFWGISLSAQRDLPPRPDGTQPPFARDVN